MELNALITQPRIYLYQNYILYAIALLLPVFPSAVPPFIVLFGLLSAYNIFKGYNKAELGEISIVIIIIYLMHILGLLPTANMERGLFDLQVKLSLLAIPLSFIGYRFLSTNSFEMVLRLFMWGTVINGLMCIAYAIYNYFYSPPPLGHYPYYFFFSGYFSALIHPNYFALYANFSLIILTYLEWPVFTSKSWKKNLGSAILILFFTLVVIFSGSKIGLFMWLVLAIGVTVLMLREVKHKLIPILSMVLILTLVIGAIQSAPTARERFFSLVRVAQKDDLNTKAKDSTSARLLVYMAGLNLALNQPWYGQGTGDFQDALDEEYRSSGYTYPLEKHLNAHNLFIQTWLSLGIAGMLLMLGLFILMFSLAFKVKDNLFLGFTAAFLMISLTESTLNVQTGVVFFAFFAVLFSRRLKVSV